MQTRINGKQISQLGVMGYLGFGALLMLIALVLGIGWSQQPFLGRYLEPNLMVSHNQPLHRGEGTAIAGMGDFVKLTAVNGEPVQNKQDLENLLDGLAAGSAVELIFDVNGEEEIISSVFEPFSTLDQLGYLYLPWIISLLFFGMAFWNYWQQRKADKNFAFSYFSISIAVVLALSFDIISSSRLVAFWLLALAASGVTLIWLTNELMGSSKAKKIVLGVTAGLSVLSYIYTLVSSAGKANELFAHQSQWLFLVTGVAYLLAFVFAGEGMLSADNPADKQRGSVLLWAGLFAFGPIGIWLMGNGLGWSISFSPWLLLPMLIFPLAVSYLVRKYQLLQTNFVINRTTQYGILAIVITIGYALMIAGLGLLFGNRMVVQNPLVLGLTIFILALLFNPLRENLFKALDKVFFRGQQAYQERLNTFSGDLTGLVQMDAILALLSSDVHEAVQPERIHVYIFDELTGFYYPQKIDGKITSDIRFSANSPLAMFLAEKKTPQIISLAHMPAEMQAEETRIKLLNANVFIPLQGQSRLLGWLSISERPTGELYSIHELNYLDALADQASLAIERSQVIGNLESRVNEMNVLTRVAQGVNYTVELDDIFELIYAQSTQIIPAEDFYLVLRDFHTDTYIQVFCVENDERVFDREQRPLPPEVTLESIVTQNRRPMNVTDYEQACRDQNAMIIREGIHAMLLAPLNTGAQTIGTMIIARRNVQEHFTDEQVRLLQSIADQVAGAIEKARLLKETDNRAKQLATLNELTRQLSSTLKLEPILENVLNNSVDILNCEAGSLLMVDDETEELVFDFVVGPVADELIKRRIPKGQGLVGKAVRTRAPIISNNVADTPDWFSKPDERTGFTTRSLLVVPLIVKDEVLGVIEVLNRKDRLPFSANDQDILAAFAAQASVALENANLYQQTDQALAERVEELSVMQRIDRELNTSLDLNRAMRITLDWALKQSGAEAGLVGFVEEGFVQIRESLGYSDEDLATFNDGVLSRDLFSIDRVIETSLPFQTRLQVDESGILPHTRVQALIPIRRENQTIALMMLESTKPQTLSEDTMSFLQRLSDHASIAIVNGQLYAEVNLANVAKSEFVSFVAHELKNPMTSIKGYTELLAAGAVGGVNDAQANFLGTIRSNIERMNTLVSDLNDHSKIEAGRLRLDFKAIAISEIVDEAVRSTKRQIEEKQQEMEIALTEDIPQVWADSTRLSQVVVNLVSNAHKYTEAGGKIEIAAEMSENKWDPDGADQVVHLWVKDSGIGISEEDQKKIFTKFFRSEDPKTREVPGTGLGLNITRSLVEMQGGKIWFDSVHREGTTFHITIPVAE